MKLTPEEEENLKVIGRELAKHSRGPFRNALQRLLGFKPTDEALQNFANKHPDRWALAVSTLANLAGYEKGVNVTFGTRKPVEQMTDQELLAERAKLAGELADRALQVPPVMLPVVKDQKVDN